MSVSSVPFPRRASCASDPRTAALELVALGLACALSLGPARLWSAQEAIGRPTRDLFDHLALLDHWSLSAPMQAFPDGGTLFPPDLGGMALAALPLALGMPRAAAWNLMIFLQLYLACVAAWALGRRYGAGLVAGVVYGLSPFLIGQALSGESETLSAWPLPVAVLLLERAGDCWSGRSARRPLGALIAAGLVSALCALGSWYYGAFIAIYLCAWALLRAWDEQRRFVASALLAPLSFALAIAGPAVVYGRILGTESQLFRGPTMAEYLSLYPRSLAGMVVDLGAIFGPPGAGAGHVDALGVVAVGFALLGLGGRPSAAGGRALSASQAGREGARWWWAVGLGALILALGPTLTVHGAPVWAWMPYRALSHLPLLGLMRLPHRWMLVVTLALAVLAARGAVRLPRLAALLIWVEVLLFLVPQRTATDIAAPSIVAAVDAPVLDLPPRMIGSDARGRYLVWQRVHHQPVAYTLLMQGLGRQIAQEPLLAAVAGLDRGDPIVARQAEAAQFRQADFAAEVARWRRGDGRATSLIGTRERLSALGYGLVLLHGDMLDADDDVAIGAMLSDLLGSPERVEGGDVLWRL